MKAALKRAGGLANKQMLLCMPDTESFTAASAVGGIEQCLAGTLTS